MLNQLLKHTLNMEYIITTRSRKFITKADAAAYVVLIFYSMAKMLTRSLITDSSVFTLL